jgi:PTH1 family peptidyl-tRNA hydrolase
MKLIVGLGNPGEKYERTRHNMGFMVIEALFKQLTPVAKAIWDDNKKFKADIAELTWQPQKDHKKAEKIILVKPKTFMNNSGMAVSAIVRFYKIAPSDVWIVNDEVDLPLGSMKIRFGGASAGHKGVTSIIDFLGTDKFWRFRMGIGVQKHAMQIRQTRHTDGYVLGNFTGKDWSKARELIKRGVKAIQTALEKDIQSAQNQYNTK